MSLASILDNNKDINFPELIVGNLSADTITARAINSSTSFTKSWTGATVLEPVQTQTIVANCGQLQDGRNLLKFQIVAECSPTVYIVFDGTAQYEWNSTTTAFSRSVLFGALNVLGSTGLTVGYMNFGQTEVGNILTVSATIQGGTTTINYTVSYTSTNAPHF